MEFVIPAVQATHGCGDLIFSSHTTFMLVGLLTYTEYGTRLPIKVRHSIACSCRSLRVPLSTPELIDPP